jgi:hypothetical protein
MKDEEGGFKEGDLDKTCVRVYLLANESERREGMN